MNIFAVVITLLCIVAVEIGLRDAQNLVSWWSTCAHKGAVTSPRMPIWSWKQLLAQWGSHLACTMLLIMYLMK